MASRLDGELRKVVFEHTIDKVDGIKFEFQNNMAGALRKLWIAKEDVRHAIACIEKAIAMKKAVKELDEIILSSLWQAAVMSYGRCFVKPMKFQPRSLYSTAEELAMHHALIALRHGYIAHGLEHRHSAVEVVVVFKESDEGFHFEWHFPGAVSVGHYMEPSAALAHLNQLSTAVEAMISKEIGRLEEQLRWDPEVVRSIVRSEQAKGNPDFARFQIPAEFQ